MQKLPLLLSILFISLFACKQAEQNLMCHDPKAEFAVFGKDPEFQAMHPSPEDKVFALKGKTVRFAVAGQDSSSAYLAKAAKKTTKYLLLFHEWWGLNDYVKNEADYWAKTLNVNVLAVDLYDGKLAKTADEAGKFMGECKPERAESIIKAAAAYTGTKTDFRTMGWCFGGGWSLKAALLLKDKTKACVMYYGMPEENVDVLKTLSTDVVFMQANKDRWINEDVVKKFEANMKSAGKSLSVNRYDADHAFANPSSPHYDEAAAKAARAVVTTYLKKH
jgi:carboxymethylenebutenolidase